MQLKTAEILQNFFVQFSFRIKLQGLFNVFIDFWSSYLGRFIPAAADTTPLVAVPLGLITLTLSPQSVVALTAIAGLSAVHVVGLGPGRIVQNVLAFP